MAMHLIGVNSSNEPTEFLFIEDGTQNKGVIHKDKLSEFIQKNRPRNIWIDNGRVVTNGKLGRYYFSGSTDAFMTPIVIIRKYTVERKTVGFDAYIAKRGKIVKVDEKSIIDALSTGDYALANGKVTNNDGRAFISSIEGSFDTVEHVTNRRHDGVSMQGFPIIDVLRLDDRYNGNMKTADVVREIHEIYLEYMGQEHLKPNSESVKEVRFRNRPRNYDTMSKLRPYIKWEGFRYAAIGQYSLDIEISNGNKFTTVVTHRDKSGNDMYGIFTNDGNMILPGVTIEDLNNPENIIKQVAFDPDVVQIPFYDTHRGTIFAFINLSNGRMTDIAYKMTDRGSRVFNVFSQREEDVLEMLSRSRKRVGDLAGFIPSYAVGRNML